MTDQNLESNQFEPIEENNPRTRPQPYANDPAYQELLRQYQNGDWSACHDLIEELLSRYPGDPGLFEFQTEVRVKQSLQKSNLVTAKEDRRRFVFKTGAWVIIGGVVLVLVLAGAFVGIGRYQARLNYVRATQQAETLLYSLTTKLSNANDLIRSGRPTGALALLEEIQEIDPEFEGLTEAIGQAEELIRLDELYLQAGQYYAGGMLEDALATYQEIEDAMPSYKDTRLRIREVEQVIEIDRLVSVIHDSYDNFEWQAMVDAKDAIFELNPATNLTEVDEKLFTAYMNLIIEVAEKDDATLEDIDLAQEYYKAALALFPQNKEFADERAELQKLATRLISNNYYIFAMDLLETEGYGPETMAEALRLLNLANNIGAGSPAITLEIERATLFAQGFDKMARSDYEGAITDLELLYRQEPGYGNGIVQYLLFEAYQAQGDVFYTYADYDSARDNYELAETFAWGDYGNTLRLFEVEIRIGYTLRRLGLLEEAAEYYNYALNLVSYQDRVRQFGEISQIEDYEAAREALAIKDEWNAARLFETVLEDYSVIYTVEEAQAKRGQSLFMVAYNSGSTVNALRQVNDLGILTSFRYDQQIQIPLFLEDAE
ncbi:MAG: hypothetical protein JW757_09665 [Anaerolineales bacterium]|nr:hypothetical protein [Anaerolineales bacterium]